MKRYWTLLLLMLVYSLSLLDRSVIGLLLDSIKTDMQVSDTVMGLITGFGFAVLYGISGIPMAWWADHANRRNIISGGLVVFSLATSLTGFAQNIWHLLLGRMALALGESTQLAPSIAILADLFQKRVRARAMAVFSMGPPIGIIFGMTSAGWLHLHYGWRTTLLVLGIPGLMLALVLRFTTTEPVRGAAETNPVAADKANFLETIGFLFGQKCFWLIMLSSALNAWPLFVTTVWGPAFLGRVYQLDAATIGFYLGTVYGIAGLLGAFTSGFVSDYLGRQDEKRKLYYPTFASILIFPAGLLFLLSDSVGLAVIGIALVSFLASSPMGPTWAIVQSITRLRMRSTASAFLQLMTNLIGLGLGPLSVGLMNDRLAATYGAESIRYSMLLIPVVSLVAGILLFIATRYIKQDIARAAAA
jgi:predicted MFS family arabinose efflux permease